MGTGTPEWGMRAATVLGLVVPLLFAGCNGGGGEVPPEPKAAGEARTPEEAALRAFDALRAEIMQGNLAALYDASSQRWRDKTFSPEVFRPTVASMPNIADKGLTAADVARLEPRELVVTYFGLVPDDQKRELALAMAEVKVLDTRRLPDGRVAVRVDSSGMVSTYFWALENGLWKMDGEEKSPEAPAGERGG